MTSSYTFEQIAASQVTDAMLSEAAELFSSAYGVWGDLASEKMGKYCKPGTRVKMSVARLREQSLAPGTNSMLLHCLDATTLAGYAFATRWVYEDRQIFQILLRLRDGQNDSGFGILSSHPAAILAALRAWGRGIEEVNLDMAREHAAGVMAASPVNYVKTAKLKGSLFGYNETDGSICCADTQFWVDHKEPLAVLAEVKKRGAVWPFGELPEGCEYLVLVKAAEVDA